MPHIKSTHAVSRVAGQEKKRKRDENAGGSKISKKRAVESSESTPDIQSEILLLENGILESRKNYNRITTLLEYMKAGDASDERDAVAAVALFRVFCRLMAAGSLTKTGDASGAEDIIVQWLKERLEDFEKALLRMFLSKDPAHQSTALTLLMRLVKEKAKQSVLAEDTTWRTGLFASIVQFLVSGINDEPAIEEFVEKYVEEYDDVRYHTFARLA